MARGGFVGRGPELAPTARRRARGARHRPDMLRVAPRCWRHRSGSPHRHPDSRAQSRSAIARVCKKRTLPPSRHAHRAAAPWQEGSASAPRVNRPPRGSRLVRPAQRQGRKVGRHHRAGVARGNDAEPAKRQGGSASVPVHCPPVGVHPLSFLNDLSRPSTPSNPRSYGPCCR